MAKTIFMMPEGSPDWDELQPGEKMQVSATVRKEQDGEACLVSVNGATVEGYSDSDDEDGQEEEESAEEEQAETDDDDTTMMDVLDKEMP